MTPTLTNLAERLRTPSASPHLEILGMSVTAAGNYGATRPEPTGWCECTPAVHVRLDGATYAVPATDSSLDTLLEETRAPALRATCRPYPSSAPYLTPEELSARDDLDQWPQQVAQRYFQDCWEAARAATRPQIEAAVDRAPHRVAYAAGLLGGVLSIAHLILVAAQLTPPGWNVSVVQSVANACLLTAVILWLYPADLPVFRWWIERRAARLIGPGGPPTATPVTSTAFLMTWPGPTRPAPPPAPTARITDPREAVRTEGTQRSLAALQEAESKVLALQAAHPDDAALAERAGALLTQIRAATEQHQGEARAAAVDAQFAQLEADVQTELHYLRDR